MLFTSADPAAPTVEDDRLEETSELALEGMHCNACATRIERALAGQPGVLSASVNLATNRAFVAYEPTEAGPEALCEAVRAVGYSAAPAAAGDSTSPRPTDPEHWSLRAAISWPLALAALGVALLAPEGATAGWTVLLLAIVVELAGGWPFLRTSVRLHRAWPFVVRSLMVEAGASRLVEYKGLLFL